MSEVRVITLRLDPRDMEELAILIAYDDTINYRKQDLLRMLLKTGLRTHGGLVPMRLPASQKLHSAMTTKRGPSAVVETITQAPIVKSTVTVSDKTEADVIDQAIEIEAKVVSPIFGLFGNQEF